MSEVRLSPGSKDRGQAGPTSRDPRPVRQLVPMVLAGIDPVDVLSSCAESSPPHDRLIAVVRLAPSPGFGVGHHAEAPAG